jgi:four helix bundle protein
MNDKSEKPEKKDNPVLEKSIKFAVKIIRLIGKFPKSGAGFAVGSQLVRAGTSIGANIQEGQRARSKQDFRNCLEIALKEASETKYWLFLTDRSELCNISDDLKGSLEEIIRLLVAIIKKLKE